MGVKIMHENFLSYIMLGLSRGLFPVQAPQSPRFDEEAFLRREARMRRDEAAERQREVADHALCLQPKMADQPSAPKGGRGRIRLPAAGRPCGAL